MIWFAELSARPTGGQFVAAIAGMTHLSDPFLNEHFYKSSGSGHWWHLSGAKEPFDYEKKIDGLINQASFEFDEVLGNVEAFTTNAFGVQEFLAVVFRRR